MLLAIDVGNSQIVVGLYDPAGDQSSADGGLIGPWRLSTSGDRTDDEFGVIIGGLLDSAGSSWDAISGVVLSSGVAQITTTLRRMVARRLDIEPVVVGPGAKSGLAIRYETREVGPDRIANGAAAFDLYGGPSIVVDLGTATTVDAVSGDGAYLGGAISPGVEIAMAALVDKAAALHTVELIEPDETIGRSTASAIRSGVLYGHAGLVDGLVGRFQAELGDAVVVATGGLADLIAPHSTTITDREPWLTLHGLRLIWHRNQ